MYPSLSKPESSPCCNRSSSAAADGETLTACRGKTCVDFDDDDDQRILSVRHSGTGLRGALYFKKLLAVIFVGMGVQLGYTWPRPALPSNLAKFTEAMTVAVAFIDAQGPWITSDHLSIFLFSLSGKPYQLYVLYYMFALFVEA